MEGTFLSICIIAAIALRYSRVLKPKSTPAFSAPPPVWFTPLCSPLILSSCGSKEERNILLSHLLFVAVSIKRRHLRSL